MCSDDDNGFDSCAMCGGPLCLLGRLGSMFHFTCRNCGMAFTRLEQEPSEEETKVAFDAPRKLVDHLGRWELVDIVGQIQRAMYMQGGDWDPDRDVNGGDIVELCGALLVQYGLAPTPKED